VPRTDRLVAIYIASQSRDFSRVAGGLVALRSGSVWDSDKGAKKGGVTGRLGWYEKSRAGGLGSCL